MTEVARMFYTVEDMMNYYSFSDDNRVRDYIYSLLGHSVSDAMRGLTSFYDSTKCGNNIFAVNEYIRNFHDFTFAIYGTEDAVKNIDCVINQIVAIRNDDIYDVGSAITHKESEVYTKFCRIPTFEFLGKNLAKGESIIQLPNPFYSQNITFYNYLVNNPDAKLLLKKA